jgi:uncharacterized protein YdcH (DUF465 family)
VRAGFGLNSQSSTKDNTYKTQQHRKGITVSKVEDDFLDDELDDEIDEHEYEITAASSRTINWRRIELVKEKMWLKEQISDLNDWAD